MAGLRIHTVMPSELVVRVDSAASAAGVSRGEFVRRAVEQALASTGTGPRSAELAPAEQSQVVRAADDVIQPRPAGMPGTSPANSRVRSSASRPFRPAPKKG